MEIIYVSMTVLPKDNKRFKDALQDIVEEARKLNGCLKYVWFPYPENSNQFGIYAEFDTEDSYYKRYKKSEAINLINQQLFPLLAGEPTFKHLQAKIVESHNI